MFYTIYEVQNNIITRAVAQYVEGDYFELIMKALGNIAPGNKDTHFVAKKTEIDGNAITYRNAIPVGCVTNLTKGESK